MLVKTPSTPIPIVLFLVVILGSFTAFAGEVQVTWSPSETASGYKLYRGTSSGQYLPPTDVGNTTSAPAEGLDDCTLWYFAVSAYNVAGESGLSSEAATWPRAVPASAGPGTVEQGSQVEVVVSGTNFRNGDVVSLSHPDVQIVGATVGSCHEMTLSLSVAPDAATGGVDVVVTHPSGVAGTGAGLFEVVAMVDETPPVISDLAAIDLDGTSAWITWSTDEAADSRVFYRKQGATLYAEVAAPDEVTEHAVPLTGLEPETVYEFHVSSTDGAGNTATTAPDESFTTTSSPHTYIRFEAEAGNVVDPVRVTEGDAAFGGAWIDTPAGLDQGTANDPLGSATFGVHIPEGGTWYLWVRLFGHDGGTNSWYETIDGAPREIVSTDSFGEWSWEAGRGHDLAEGLHVVELAGRESETRIDRVLLTDDPDFVPTEQPDLDITPPGAVEALAAAPLGDAIELTWVNPADADLATTVIRYRTDGQYPTSPADGLPVVVQPALPGALESLVHDGIDAGVTYHYSAFSLDGAGNVSDAAHATGMTVGVPSPPLGVVVH